MSFKPFFVVNACSMCEQHQWCTRHNEAKYFANKQAVISAIKTMLPNLEDSQIIDGVIPDEYCNGCEVVLDNWTDGLGQTRSYTPTPHLIELAQLQYYNEPRGLPPAPLGAMEVFFMGVRMFSKIQSGMWPNPTRVAQRCAEAYNAYQKGGEIEEYETMLFARPPPHLIEQHEEMMATAYTSGAMETGMMPRMASAGGGPRKQAAAQPKVKFNGRKITVEECKFIFDRIWKATVEHSTEEDLALPMDVKADEANLVMMEDLFHVIDLTAKLLNKAPPDGEDTKPFDEFLKSCMRTTIADEDGQDPQVITFAETSEMPKILFRIFAGQPDLKQTDAAQIINKLGPQTVATLPQQLLDSIVEQVWAHHDKDKSGILDRSEAFNFIGMTLEIRERTLALAEKREPVEVTEKDIEEVFEACDIDHSGNLSKDEVKAWIRKYMADRPEKAENIMKAAKKLEETV